MQILDEIEGRGSRVGDCLVVVVFGNFDADGFVGGDFLRVDLFTSLAVTGSNYLVYQMLSFLLDKSALTRELRQF